MGQRAPAIGQRRRLGFTLVEVMIVVAVIALLATIAIPNFLKARNTARVKACMANLRAMDTAKVQWAFDAKKLTSAIPTSGELGPYLQDKRIPDCPANGSYRLRSLRRQPNCSLWPEGHTLANANGDDDPDAD